MPNKVVYVSKLLTQLHVLKKIKHSQQDHIFIGNYLCKNKTVTRETRKSIASTERERRYYSSEDRQQQKEKGNWKNS